MHLVVKQCTPRHLFTIVNRVACSSLSPPVPVGFKADPRWFYAGLLSQLRLETKYYRSAAKRQLQEEVEILRVVHHQKVACVLDEAHLLEEDLF